MPLRSCAALAVVAFALAVLTGCGGAESPKPTPSPSQTAVTKSSVPDREPRTLVLKATGSAKVTAIKYTLDRKVKKKGAVKLPWRQSVTVPADGKPHSYRLDVTFKGNGHIRLMAIFDGSVVAQGGSGGSGSSVTGRSSVGGSVTG